MRNGMRHVAIQSVMKNLKKKGLPVTAKKQNTTVNCPAKKSFFLKSDMKMSSRTSGKRKSTDNNIPDECSNLKKQRKDIEDDIIVLDDDDIEKEDKSVRRKFIKKCLLYTKKRKDDITKMTHRELMGILVEKFVETFTLNSTIRSLRRELDDAYKTIDLLKEQCRNMSKSVMHFDLVLKRLNTDLKTRVGFVRPIVVQRSVGLQISTSTTKCNNNLPKSQSLNDSQPVDETKSASDSQQNDRILGEQTEIADSPRINVETIENNKMNEDNGVDDLRADESLLGSSEPIPELNQRNSENEEPTEENILEQDKTSHLPIEYLNSDEDSDSETEFEIFKESSALVESNEIPDATNEISVDDLGEVTADEVIRVLSSCGLINPDENEIVSDNELLNVPGENEKIKELVTGDSVCPKLTESDSKQNMIQAKSCDKINSVCEGDTRHQDIKISRCEADTPQVQNGISEITPSAPKGYGGERNCFIKDELLIANNCQKFLPEQQEKENIQPPTNEQETAEVSINQLPAPSLCGIKEGLDTVLTWVMPDDVNHKSISSFEILYTFDEMKNELSEWSWKQIGVIENTDYPVMCKLGKFQAGRNYCFSVRAVDKYKKYSPYSNVYKVEF